MKAQQIGLVLGMNVVAACLMMQGCKATKPGVGGSGYKPADPVVVADTTPAPESPVVRDPVVKVTNVPEVAPAPAPKTSEVKPIAPVADKPAVSPAPKKPAAVGEVYVVQKGDSLSKISKRFNVKLSAIVAANPGIKPDRIRIGQKVKIPGAVPAAPAVASAPASAAKKAPDVAPASASAANLKPPAVKTGEAKPYTGATKKYVVKAGDTLGGIAHDSGITVSALKKLNGLERNVVRIGQELKIPAEKQVAAAKKPTAAKADAKADAVKKSAADKPAAAKDGAKKEVAADKPAAANDGAKKEVAADKPAEGKSAEAKPAEVTVDAAADSAPFAAAAEGDAPISSANTHVVKEGEDLIAIAIEHSVSPSSLAELNDIKPTDGVKPGQVLKLPANAK